MKQITIVHQNNALHIAGVKDNGEIIEPELTESLQTLIYQLIEALDEIKTPEEELQERMKDYIEENAPDETLLDLIYVWPEWETLIGQEGVVGKLLQKDGRLYRIYQALPLIMEHQPPEQLRAHYLWIQHPEEEGQVLPWEDRHGMGKELYKIGDRVTHQGFYWKSLINDNSHEPTEAAYAAWEKEGPIE